MKENYTENFESPYGNAENAGIYKEKRRIPVAGRQLHLYKYITFILACFESLEE